MRTGWNQNERTLKPSNLNASSLHVLSLQLGDNNVATENNSVYAVDAGNHTKLKKVNFGDSRPLADRVRQ